MAVIRAVQMANTTPKAREIEEAFGAKDITSSRMLTAVRAWSAAYYDDMPTEGSNPAQRLPYIVVNKLAKTTFSEYEATSDDGFAQSALDALDKKRKEGVQQALIGGEALLKPVFMPTGTISLTVIARENYLVFGRSPDGELTDIGTNEVTIEGGYYYTLLERRTVDNKGYLTITSQLFRSRASDMLGDEVPLTALEKYSVLRPRVTYNVPVYSIGLAQVRTPMENCVDGSVDSVSVYAPALELIRLININEAQISAEFERGESRIIVSNDMMDADERGERVFKDHIFSGLPDGPEMVGVTIFSPEFREQSFLARKAEYLRNMESLIGLKRGILSEVEAAERTATEVTSSAGDYNLTVIEFQQMWETAAREFVRICGVLGKLYGISGAVEIADDEIIISWGNGVLYDEEKEWAALLDLVGRGLLKPEYALGWKYNMPTETEQELAAIRIKYMPDIDSLLATE